MNSLFTMHELLPVLPMLILAAGATVLILSEVFLSAASRTYQAALTLATTAAASASAFHNVFEEPRLALQGYAALDAFGSFLALLVCVATGLTVLFSVGFLRHRNAERGEFYALLLFAAAGMCALGVSAEFITLFVNLEVFSIATYALTSFLRRGHRPAEAGFKYFILGAFSGAILLYGFALLYGATGTTRLSELGPALKALSPQHVMLAWLGVALTGLGFAFKLALVPFHMWTPDVYEGAPTPVTALMSAGVKGAALVALVRVFAFIGAGLGTQYLAVAFSALALLTMVGGNLLALSQRNVKRMLAYSSIAHAGYLFLGVTALFAAPSSDAGGLLLRSTPLLAGVQSLAADTHRSILFYLLSYTVTTLGAFGLLAAIERREDETRATTWDLERLSGLAQRRPGWALAMAVFMLSLGGIPPTVGFVGKFLVLRAAVDAGFIGLAVVGVLASAAGIYYYLRVIVYMYMRPARAEATYPERHWMTEAGLVACAIAIVWLGAMPGAVSGWLSQTTLLLGPK